MRKIVLNESNYKQVVALMQKMLKYSFRVYHGRDANVKALKMKDVRIAALSGRYNISRYIPHMGIKVAPHPFTDPRNGNRNDRIPERRPLIHLDYGSGRAAIYYAGDVFYFYGGNMIKVNRCSKGAKWFFAVDQYMVMFDIFVRGAMDGVTLKHEKETFRPIKGRVGNKGIIAAQEYQKDHSTLAIPPIISTERYNG